MGKARNNSPTALLIAALSTSSCMVGPDFHEPDAPTVNAYTPTDCLPRLPAYLA